MDTLMLPRAPEDIERIFNDEIVNLTAEIRALKEIMPVGTVLWLPDQMPSTLTRWVRGQQPKCPPPLDGGDLAGLSLPEREKAVITFLVRLGAYIKDERRLLTILRQLVEEALARQNSYVPPTGKADIVVPGPEVPDVHSDSAAKHARALEELNEKYAVVNDGGKVVVFRRVHDKVLARFVIERFSFEDFKRLYQNIQMALPAAEGKTPKLIELGSFWLKHPERRQYEEGVTFDPSGAPTPGRWNMWSGFPVSPQAGDWNLMKEHIRNVICGGDEERYSYLLRWMARMFQNPLQPGHVAVVMRGKEGSGKGTLGNWIARAWGQHAVHITNSAHLVGKFNAHLRDCVFVFADEAFFAGDPRHVGVLKALITEPTIVIEKKGRDVITAPNMTHIIMASNNDWVIPASGEARRYFVLDVADDRIGDGKYFDALNHQMENGGLAAMIHDLLTMDISDFRVAKFPITSALNDQKARSMTPEQEWLVSVLQRGYVYRSRHGGTEFRKWGDFCATELLFRSYAQHCDDMKVQRRKSRVTIGVFLANIYDPGRPRGEAIIDEVDSPVLGESAVVKKDRPPGYNFGPLNEARKRFCDRTGLPVEWPEFDVAEDDELPF